MITEADIPEPRRSEYQGLVRLLMSYARVGDDGASDVAELVASACLKDGHLWRAMGLGDRLELRVMLERSFPELAAGNTRDMRWKKYLYRRLCGWPGFQG